MQIRIAIKNKFSPLQPQPQRHKMDAAALELLLAFPVPGNHKKVTAIPLTSRLDKRLQFPRLCLRVINIKQDTFLQCIAHNSGQCEHSETSTCSSILYMKPH